MKSLLRVFKIVAINVVVVLVLFALLEGSASLLMTANQVRRTAGVTEQYHSVYDSTLGWVSRPNVNLPNLYGPGIYLRTNSQSFRADRDFTREVPAGKTRIICSGDSFTLGFGVSNDQAYLWYKRAGAQLDHQVQLLAFITNDFQRMQGDRFVGYGKPMLGLRGDSIVILNRPVPRTSSFTRWRAVKGHAVTNLNIVQVARRLLHLDRDPSADSVAARDAVTRKVAARIFADLAQTNRAKGSRLVLVYLPGLGDYKVNPLGASWRAFVREEAARQGIPFLDLIEPLQKVPSTEIDSLFEPDGHYSPAGNDFVARELHRNLTNLLGLTPAAAAQP
jgi:lysophospholipase L1-like esterase